MIFSIYRKGPNGPRQFQSLALLSRWHAMRILVKLPNHLLYIVHNSVSIVTVLHSIVHNIPKVRADIVALYIFLDV